MSETDGARCPYCGNPIVIPPGPLAAGQTVQCAACGRPVVVGAAPTVPPPPPFAPAGAAPFAPPMTPLGYSPPAPTNTKKIVLIVLACVVGLGVIVCGCMASILIPSLNRAREQANRVKCASNLRYIGQGIQMYANMYKGELPDTIDKLITKQDMSTESFVCPRSTDTPATGANAQAQAANLTSGGHLSYVYVGKGMNWQAPSSAVLAYEPLSHHADGVNVLFADGHVSWVPAAQARKIIADVQAGTNPPTGPKF